MALFTLIIALAAAGTFTAISITSKEEPEVAKMLTKPVVKKLAPVFYSPLSGKIVSQADSKLPVIGVMIENSTEARPQSGLAEADVVFESVAEAGITRFLVLYQGGKPTSIGPIRSVRPQFASLTAGFDGALAHVGGSDIPLAKLRSGQIKDLDQFFNAASFQRSSSRAAPHNVYSSWQNLFDLSSQKGWTASNFEAWPRMKPLTIDQKAVQATAEAKAKTKSKATKTSRQKTTDKPPQNSLPPAPALPAATIINLPVSSGQFATSYQYNTAANSYARLVAGTAQQDQEKGAVTPSVVVALQVPHNVICDSNRYCYPDVNGSGSGWLFQNGVAEDITWQKADDKSPLRLLNKTTNQPLTLVAGQTWIALIPTDQAPTWQ